jgi:hypothetical protein
MDKKPGDTEKRRSMLARVVTPVALWALTHALDTRPMKKISKELDTKVEKKKKSALKAARRAGKNALSNRAWLAASMAAFAAGIGLAAKAARR